MRKERSFTAPAAQEPKGQAVLPTPEKWHVDGFPSLSMPYMSILSVGKDIKVSEHLRNDWEKKRIARSQSQTDPPILAHGVRYALPAYDSIPGSRVCPLFSGRDSAGPTCSVGIP
jgi:hypothetical protein